MKRRFLACTAECLELIGTQAGVHLMLKRQTGTVECREYIVHRVHGMVQLIHVITAAKAALPTRSRGVGMQIGDYDATAGPRDAHHLAGEAVERCEVRDGEGADHDVRGVRRQRKRSSVGLNQRSRKPGLTSRME